jgi:uncharacterized membrane protein
MTNKKLWLFALLATFIIVILASLFYVIAYNFPYFADAIDRAFGSGDLVSIEDFVKRILLALVWGPIFLRGVFDLLPEDCDEEGENG